MADPIPKPTVVDTKVPAAAKIPAAAATTTTTPATQAATTTTTQTGANGLPTNLRPKLSVVSVKAPNGNWVPSGIQVMKWDAKTQSYPWQTKDTETRLGYGNVRQAGFKDGQWGVDTRTGYVVPWTNRGTTTDANGKQVAAQWNDDMSIMSPEQFSRYSMYSAQDSNAPNYQQYHPLRDIHNANPYIRETARNFARTGEYTPYDITKVYDRDAYYRGDAAAAEAFDRLSEEFGYGQYNSSPYSSERYQDPLYRQMFFDRNKRQMYQMASTNAQRWKTMTGLRHSTNQAYPSDAEYYNTTYKSDMRRIRTLIPNYDSLPQAQKLAKLRDLYSKISTGEIPNSYSLGPRISMLFYGMTKGNTVTGDSINYQVPYKDWSFGDKYLNFSGRAPVYLPKYTADIYRPTDPVQLATARHFGLIGSEGQVLEDSDVAENFINQNRWFWDPAAYEQHVVQQHEKGKSQADADVDNFFLYKSPGFYTQSQMAAASGRSSAMPAWLRSNPLVTDIDASYIGGVNRSGQDVYNYNERTLGGASHIAGSAMRGGINFFTLGTGNDFADWAFKKLGDGSSMEENFARAVQHGANPYALAASGLVAESYPLILSLGTSGAASAPSTVGNASRLANMGRTLYTANRGMRTYNTATNSLIRQLSYLHDPDSAAGKAMRISAKYGDMANTILPFAQGWNPLFVSAAMNAPQYAGRNYEMSKTDDPALKRELSVDQIQDGANFGFDALVAYATGGKFKGSIFRRVAPVIGMTAPALTRGVAEDTVNALEDPNSTWTDYVPGKRILSNWLSGTEMGKNWNTQLTIKDMATAARHKMEVPGYYDPNSESYWKKQWFGGIPETATPEERSKHMFDTMFREATSGVMPADFFTSQEFKELPATQRMQITQNYMRGQAFQTLNTGDADLIKAFTSKSPDVDILFTDPRYKNDPRFADMRSALTATFSNMSIDDALDLAAQPGFGEGSGNTVIRNMVMNSPAIKSFDFSTATPALFTKIDSVMQTNPAFKNIVLDKIRTADFTTFTQRGTNGGSKGNSHAMTWLNSFVSTDAEANEAFTQRLNTMSNSDIVGVVNAFYAPKGQTQGKDAEPTQTMPKALTSMFADNIKTRLQRNDQNAADLAYRLTPYLKQSMGASKTGFHVSQDLANAFVQVMAQPAYWNKFDRNSMLQFCEFMNSKAGRQAFGKLDGQAQTEWLDRIKSTVEPIASSHAWSALKEGDIETFRRYTALKYSFADDPILFYGASAALILGGITVLGNIFSSNDDDDDEDEDEEDADDDAAYRKRMRKRLQQQKPF